MKEDISVVVRGTSKFHFMKGHITLSNGTYDLKNLISNTKAKVMIIVGGKEIGIMKKSAKRLNDAIAGSQLNIIPKMAHDEISLLYPEKYVELIRTLL